METYGGLGPQAMVAVKRLGKALAHASEDGDEDGAINAVGTKLAFVCQQGLARSFHARYTTTLHQHNSCSSGCCWAWTRRLMRTLWDD